MEIAVAVVIAICIVLVIIKAIDYERKLIIAKETKRLEEAVLAAEKEAHRETKETIEKSDISGVVDFLNSVHKDNNGTY